MIIWAYQSEVYENYISEVKFSQGYARTTYSRYWRYKKIKVMSQKQPKTEVKKDFRKQQQDKKGKAPF